MDSNLDPDSDSDDSEYETVELDPDAVTVSYGPDSRSHSPKRPRPSASDRTQRLATHLLHVQCLLYHGYTINRYLNETRLQKKIKKHLPKDLKELVSEWSKTGGDLGPILSQLVEHLRARFTVTERAVRRLGYGSNDTLKCTSQYPDSYKKSFNRFAVKASDYRGSIDLAAQLFVCICRSLGFRTTLVFSLPCLGFSFKKQENVRQEDVELVTSKEEVISVDVGTDVYIPPVTTIMDHDLVAPTFWCHILDPNTNHSFTVDPWIFTDPICSDLKAFELRGRTSRRQRMAYVVGYEDDRNVVDLTAKYTKPHATTGQSAAAISRRLYLAYVRWYALRPAEAMEPEGPVDFPSTITGYKGHPKWILWSQLRQDQAVPDGIHPIHTFEVTSAKGRRLEKVYNRTDVVVCRPATSWIKEGRRIKSEQIDHPRRRNSKRASTIQGKRKLEMKAKHGEQNHLDQALYSYDQTELFIPEPIVDGIIPKNEFGSIECFQPHMIPKGAVHLQYPGLKRVADKLGIDSASAVVGFTFGSRRAKPIIDGVVVAENQAQILIDAWRQDNAIKQAKLKAVARKVALKRWREYLAKLRVIERIDSKYGQSFS